MTSDAVDTPVAVLIDRLLLLIVDSISLSSRQRISLYAICPCLNLSLFWGTFATLSRCGADFGQLVMLALVVRDLDEEGDVVQGAVLVDQMRLKPDIKNVS